MKCGAAGTIWHVTAKSSIRKGRRRVSEARGEIALYLCGEMGLSMAEIARNLGVGTSAIAIAMAIRKGERGTRV